MSKKRVTTDHAKLDQVVADQLRHATQRGQGYREQALKMYPWICGRCTREFTHANLRELTVHHRNHNHDDNPADGSNWELLCVYCHDNEHQKQIEHRAGTGSAAAQPTVATGNPFADLKSLMKKP